MNRLEFKRARVALKLTQSECAKMLDTDEQSIRRIEGPSTNSTARKVAPRMARLMQAYMWGHRPSDWPKQSERVPRGRPASRVK